MTRNMTTIGKLILGAGHVMEDDNPTPLRLRKPGKSKPIVEGKKNDTRQNFQSRRR